MDKSNFFIDSENEYDMKILEALEKQIPKKPYFEGDGYADGELVYDSFICPNCGMNYEYYDETYQIEHCSFCGQALDFGGVNIL